MSEVRVPDIGDFTDVPVVEVLVAVGDAVAPEDPLITLESDKASMDVPAPEAGVVEELLVDVGGISTAWRIVITCSMRRALMSSSSSTSSPHSS